MNHPLSQIFQALLCNYTILLVRCWPTDNPTDFNWGCCTESNPCFKDRGDCDKDSECLGQLVCGNNNCGDGAHPGLDCCLDASVKCNPAKIDWHCCTSSSPCGLGKGDCAIDYDCAGDLVCGEDNCGRGALDCCVRPLREDIKKRPLMITK